MQLAEERAESLLRVDVDAGGRLVEDEELRFAGERLRDEGPLLLAAGKRAGSALPPGPRDRRARSRRRPPRGRRRPNGLRRPRRGDAAGGRRPRARWRASRCEPGALGEIARCASGRARDRRARQRARLGRSAARSRPSAIRSSVVLPPPFGPATVANSPVPDLEVDAAQDHGPAGVGERDVLQLDG